MDLKSLAFICVFLLFQSLDTDALEKNQYPPKADAHYDQFANINETVKLNASNSTDKDGGPLSYQWIIIERPEGSLAKVQDDDHVTSYLTLDKAGTYTIELLVSDGLHVTSSDTLVIDTEQTKPQLSEINDQKVLVGESAELEIQDAFDPDGDDILMFWDLEKSPMGSSAQIQNPTSESPTIITDKPGKYSIRLQVSDNKHIIKSNLFKVHAVEFFDRSNRALGCVLDRIFFDGFEGLFTNTAPVADVGPDTTGVIGQTIVLDGSLSSDIDLDTLTYSWSLLTAPNGSTAVIDNDDQIQAGLTPDLVGDYVAQLIVNDGCLDSDPDSALVTISVNQPPTITSTPDTSVRESQAYSYQVVATDPENHSLDYDLSISPAGASIDSNGLMTWQSLGEGTYPVTVVVTDEYNATDSQSYDIDVTVNNAPQIQSFPISSAEKDLDYSYQVVVSDADSDPITYQLINPESGMSIDNNGLITWTPTSAGNFSVEVNVDDGFGGTDSQSFSIEVIELPPNPIDIAPPLSKTEFEPFIDTISFIYDATPPIQLGLDVNALDDYRVSVLKGRILDSSGSPLPGVRISINNRPEFGHTYSRSDGQYDIVANGGGTLTLNFDKGGYLPSQRDIKAKWEQFSFSEDVVLIRLDDQLTEVDLSDQSVDFHVAQGSIVTDEDGTRQATILFPSGTNASLEFSDGTTQPISQISVRATEYTVGALGKKRMPGNLPSSSGYTYAVELSVDEALTSQATSVNFDQQIPFYVDNFLDFPQGEPVPLGYYERSSAYWVPAPNGIVLKILRIENNRAVLDVTNDDIDNDADPVELDILGISDAELQQLALLYPAGKTLWRSQVDHFTPWDCNWPYAFPEDILDPPEDPPAPSPPEDEEDETPEDEPEKNDENEDCEGCVINANNRTLEHSVPITGTNLSLHYRSRNNSISQIVDSYEIPITHSTVDPKVKRIELGIWGHGLQSGQLIEFNPSDNLSHLIEWDGRDVYGRFTHQSKITYKVNYYYDAVYVGRRYGEEWTRLFSVFVDRGDAVLRDRDALEVILQKNNQVTFYRRGTSQGSVRSADVEGEEGLKNIQEEQLKMGGWTINDHHVYDPINKILYEGDGFIRDVTTVESQLAHDSGNGGQATAAVISKATILATGPDGATYLYDDVEGHIRKISEDGIITRVAGKNHTSPPFPYCFGVTPIEGESAFDLCLDSLGGIAIHPDGTVYFSYDNRIRKIDTDGNVYTVAGTGNSGFSNDGNLALLSDINPSNLQFDKHENLYFFDNSGLLRYIDDQDRIYTVAGGGFIDPFEPEFSGVSSLSTELFNPASFSISDAGSIVIADTGHECFRQVTPDNYIYTILGSEDCYITQDTRGTHETLSYPKSVAFDNNGGILLLDVSDPNLTEPINKLTKVTPHGLTEVLSENTPGFSGDGGDITTAQINHPGSISINGLNEILIADTENNRIRKVRIDNSIITIAGTGLSNNESTKFANSPMQSKQNTASALMGSTSNFIASRDGSMLHEFSDAGVHLKTLDSITGRVYRTYTYDGNGLLNSITDENGLSIQINRDIEDKVEGINSPYGKLTQLSYFADGSLEKVIDPNLEEWVFEYTNGYLTAFTDRNSHRYEYSYDSDGLLKTDLNPLGGGWTITPNNIAGENSITYTTAEGREYEFVKNKTPNFQFETIYSKEKPDGQIETKTVSDAGKEVIYSDGTVYTSEFFGTPRLGSHFQFVSEESVTTPSGLTTESKYFLDEQTNFGTIAPVVYSEMTRTTNTKPWKTSYDLNIGTYGGYNHITPEMRTSEYELDSNSRIISSQLTGFDKVHMEYDSFGRLARAYKGENADLREYLYDYYDSGQMEGEVKSITNPLGEVYEFEYDNNGQVTKQILPNTQEVIYTYDGNGNLTSIKPPNKPVHSFEYDGINNLTKYIAPTIPGVTNSETVYDYNLDDQLTSVTLPDGRVRSYNYSPTTGLMTSITTTEGSYLFTHDPVTSKVATSSSPHGITSTYTYDGFLPVSMEYSGAITGKVSRTYDDLFRVSSRTINDTDTINYQYDDDNLLTQAGDLVLTLSTQRGGILEEATIDNLTTVLNYSDFMDKNGESTTHNGTLLYEYSIVRDKLSRVKFFDETYGTTSSNYEYLYNAVGQLTEVKKDGITENTWDYDSNGNRTHEDGLIIATYDDQDRLINFDGVSFTYNDSGEVHTKVDGTNTTTYQFDSFGFLYSVTDLQGLNVEYDLDSVGRRVARKVNGTITNRYLYSNGLDPIAEMDANGTVITRYVYGDKPNVPSYMIKAGVKYRIISNHLGSPTRVVNTDTGQIMQEIQYDAWGNIITDTNPGFQMFGFAGGIYDQDTKLTRFGYREYDSKIGRWLTKDPIKFTSHHENLYAYLNSNPVTLIDETGLRGIRYSRPINPNQKRKDQQLRERWEIKEQKRMDNKRKLIETGNKKQSKKLEHYVEAIEEFVQNHCSMSSTCVKDRYAQLCLAWKCGLTSGLPSNKKNTNGSNMCEANEEQGFDPGTYYVGDHPEGTPVMTGPGGFDPVANSCKCVKSTLVN